MPKKPNQTFEQAFTELNKIVTQLEDDDLTLDATVALFERGRLLARYCQSLLDSAQLRVSQIGEDEGEAPAASEDGKPPTNRTLLL
ncbi:MAG: exodeoxyribonuclease VII small subunit [Pleurocapsa minor GSE-CHR-MK-17-07R]|jgi:exodeoxyribonuclease VII small subunit|nr:exodeoxyribonuclease VII small subunit [Pleurocapsa minor GSE-CHR-MK 17-07R]